MLKKNAKSRYLRQVAWVLSMYGTLLKKCRRVNEGHGQTFEPPGSCIENGFEGTQEESEKLINRLLLYPAER